MISPQPLQLVTDTSLIECPINTLTLEVLRLFSCVTTSKAAGLDQISAKGLKIVAPVITPSLTLIFNQSIRTWLFPFGKLLQTLEAGDYSKIETTSKPRVAFPRELVTELTKCCWTIMSPGYEVSLLLTRVHRDDYDQLFGLDVLGLQNTATSDQENV